MQGAPPPSWPANKGRPALVSGSPGHPSGRWCQQGNHNGPPRLSESGCRNLRGRRLQRDGLRPKPRQDCEVRQNAPRKARTLERWGGRETAQGWTELQACGGADAGCRGDSWRRSPGPRTRLVPGPALLTEGMWDRSVWMAEFETLSR